MSLEDNIRERQAVGAEIIDKRDAWSKNGHPGISGYNTIWFIELIGGKVITYTAFEPDPNTHRDEFYYNVLENVLYKKIKIDGINAWKPVSN